MFSWIKIRFTRQGRESGAGIAGNLPYRSLRVAWMRMLTQPLPHFKFNAITFCRSSSPTQCPSPFVPLSTILAIYLRRLLHFLTMMLAHAPLKWADPEDSDIPGEQSASSDDSEPPWPPYTVLEESDVWRELRMLARPHSTPAGARGKVQSRQHQLSTRSLVENAGSLCRYSAGGKRSAVGIHGGFRRYVPVN